MNVSSLFLTSTDATKEAAETLSKTFMSKPIGDIIKDFAPKILIAILIYVVGMVVVRIIIQFLDKALVKSRIDKVLFPLIKLIIKMVFYIIIFISCIDALNIPITSLITALGAVGLAVSLAVKDSLANVASGIVVILSKPFALDDYVKIGDCEGTVKEIGFVYTILGTIDNKQIMIPNSQVSSSKIVNYSAEKMRRLDLKFSIGYNDDIKKAKQIILDEIEKTGLALPEPAPPFVGVGAHGASSIELSVRIWVPTDDFWTLNFELLENVKYAFDENNISIPYNQLDVHINNN